MATLYTYEAPSGEVIYGGRELVLPDPDLLSAAWPPGANCVVPAVGGVDAPLHPKVLDTAGFGGYRYWMAFTPYPTSNDDKLENPSVVASSDGDTWTAPATNPIEPAPSGAATGYKYYADTHLALVDGVLYLFFILNVSTGYYSGTRTTTVYVRTSTDGVTWTEKVAILEEITTDTVSLLSPCISFHAGKWWMWSYDSATVPISCHLRQAEDLEGPWSEPVACTLTLADALREPWHFDVARITGGWAMLISDRQRADKTKGRLWFAISADGITWTCRSSAFSTASPNVYRSSLVPAGAGYDCWITDWDARKVRRLRLDQGS